MTTAVGPVPQSPSDIRDLTLTDLVPHPANRKQFDKAALDELAASLKQEGQLNALIVRPLGKQFQILAGDRRWRAAKLAGWTTIRCGVKEVDDHTALRLVVVDNLQRENPTPLQEADGYAALEADGMTIQEVATAVAKQPEYVHRRLQLRQLIPVLRKQLEQGELGLGVALQCARLSAETQKRAAGEDRWALESERDMKRWLGEEVLVQLSRAPFDPKDAALLPKAGACTTCPKRTGMSPTLWGDISGKDTCTDPPCFQAKEAALVNQRIVELTNAGHSPVFITTEYYSDDGGKAPKGAKVLTRYHYQVAKQTDKKAVPAVVVDGEGIGRVIYVTVGEPESSRGGAREPMSSYAKKAVAAQKRAKLETKVRIELVKQARERLDAMPAAKVAALSPLRTTLLGYVTRLHHEGRRAVANGLGLEAKKKKYGGADFEQAIVDHIGTIKDEAGIQRLAFAIPALVQAQMSSWDVENRRTGIPTGIAQLCEAVGLKAETAAAKIRSELKDPKKAKAVKKRAGDVARAKKAKKKGGR